MTNPSRPNFLERGQNKTPETSAVPETIPAQNQAPATPVALPHDQVGPTPTVTLPDISGTNIATANQTEQRLRHILSEDMAELMADLPADQKKEVQIEGLKTVDKLQLLLRQAHLKVKQIWELVWSWLKRFSGVNRFFLEQEVKKKTEEVLELRKELERKEQ